MTKKILAALLAVMMIVSLLPATFAVTYGCPGVGADHSKDNCTNYEAEGAYVEPGCCTPGYQLYVCKDCGEHFASDIQVATPADDCTWKLESAYVAPDCLNDGAWAKYVCEVGQIGVKYTDADGNTVDPESAAAQEAIDALGHDYGDIVNCHDGKICQREGCGYAAEQGKHSWEANFNYEDIVIDVEPGELTKGEFHYVCADCGAESERFEIVVDGHTDANMTKKDAEPATCAKPGHKEYYVCANECCAGKYYTRLGANDYREVSWEMLITDTVAHTYKQPTDADYDAWVTHIDPTCMTNGYTYKKCTVCEEWIEDTSEKIPAGEEHHSWTILTPAVEGDCENIGKTEVKACSVCRRVVGGDVIEGTGEGHAVQTVTFAGTCIKVAYEFTYCTNEFCTKAKVTSLTDGTNTIDLTEIAADGVKILSYSFGTVNTAVHNIGWHTTQQASCVAGGHQVKLCLDCLENSTATGESRPIAPSEEFCNFNANPIQGATCTEQAIYKCAYCGREEKRGEPLGHNYEGQPIQYVYAHCVGTSGAGVDGYSYKVCKNCNTEKYIIETIEYEIDYIYEDEETARAQHSLPNTPKAIYVQGDCDTQGLWTLGDCTDCGRTVLMIDDETGHGHTEAPNSRVNPTCTAAGYYLCQNSYCSLPGKKIVLPALGHTLVKVDAKDADCVNDGNYEHYRCTRTDCGKILVAAANFVISADQLSLTMPAMNLRPEMWITPGNTAFSGTYNGTTITLTTDENTVDGTYSLVTTSAEYTFIIEDGKFVAALTETTASQVIPALGHDSHIKSLGFGSALNPSNVNNCINFAYANVKWCGRCAYSVMEGYKAATGHDYSDNADDLIFDDCEADGYYECGNGCGVDKLVPGSATGHKNSDGDFFFSGCEDDEDNRHCVVCCAKNGTDPETCTGVDGVCLISKEHDYYVLIDDAPATCDQPGYDLEVCNTCGYEHIVVNENAPAHNHLNGAAYVWNNYTEDGRLMGVCSLCGDVKYRDDVSFEIKIDNADAPGMGYTQFSRIEVTINLCAGEAVSAIRGFNFCLMTSGVVYIDNEYVSEDFDIYTVTTPENALNVTNGIITVNGMASNNRLGEKQNIEVTGKNAVIKLYFRVMEVSDVAFYIPSVHEGDSDSVSAWKYTYNADLDAITKGYTYGGAAYAEVKEYMDITVDGATTMTDVLEAYEMISNPNAGESTYNVVMDVNKNGLVEVNDLEAIMNFLSGNYDEYDYEQMLMKGIEDADELALLAQIGYGTNP